MSLDGKDAPKYQLISTDYAKESLFEKLSVLEAYTEETAVLVEDLDITEEEDIAFDESVLEEEIIVFREDDLEYCYLAEYYEPVGSHKRKVKILSIPVIILCSVMTIFTIVFFIYQIIAWFA